MICSSHLSVLLQAISPAACCQLIALGLIVLPTKAIAKRELELFQKRNCRHETVAGPGGVRPTESGLDACDHLKTLCLCKPQIGCLTF